MLVSESTHTCKCTRYQQAFAVIFWLRTCAQEKPLKNLVSAIALGFVIATAAVISMPTTTAHAQTTTNKPKKPVVLPDSIPPWCPPDQPDCTL